MFEAVENSRGSLVVFDFIRIDYEFLAEFKSVEISYGSLALFNTIEITISHSMWK